MALSIIFEHDTDRSKLDDKTLNEFVTVEGFAVLFILYLWYTSDWEVIAKIFSTPSAMMTFNELNLGHWYIDIPELICTPAIITVTAKDLSFFKTMIDEKELINHVEYDASEAPMDEVSIVRNGMSVEEVVAKSQVVFDIRRYIGDSAVSMQKRLIATVKATFNIVIPDSDKPTILN